MDISMGLFWYKQFIRSVDTYSLFEQMYGNFCRYPVVKIICGFCPKLYMEITVDFFWQGIQF